MKKHLALPLSLYRSYAGQGMWCDRTYPVSPGHRLSLLY